MSLPCSRSRGWFSGLGWKGAQVWRAGCGQSWAGDCPERLDRSYSSGSHMPEMDPHLSGAAPVHPQLETLGSLLALQGTPSSDRQHYSGQLLKGLISLFCHLGVQGQSQLHGSRDQVPKKQNRAGEIIAQQARALTSKSDCLSPTPAPTWWLSTICNATESSTLFWRLQALCDTQTLRQAKRT